MLASFLSGEFLLHIPCWLHFVSFFFFLWSFSYTSHTCFIFLWGVSLTHPVLASFLTGEFLLHVRCFFFFFFFFFFFSLSLFLFSFSGDFLLHIPCRIYYIWGVSLTQPMLVLFCSGEILLHVPRTYRAVFCCCCFNLGSSSSTSHAGFIFIWGVSLTHPVLASFLFGEFLLHIPCWFHFYLACFSYTSHAPASFSYTSHAAFFSFFFLIWGASLTHPVLALILSADFLLHITCWLHFYRGSLSYPYRAGFCFLFLSGEFLLHIPC